MSELEPLIADLALILICAGAMTLLFKRLKQPVVLGYIVAGFITSPNMPYMPSVTDMEGIHLWSEIGVIFLLFALGLEFSFKKILKMGTAPIIAACTIILAMMLVGAFTGHAFGWKQMDCIYLGGMLAMSSTTIIFKAIDDMGLRQQRFASLVLSVLIIEDILAIVLMVMLSTLAVSKEFEGTQMLMSILKLVFFLVLWFVVGIYLIPLLLKKTKSLMSEETLLITALALCFGMVVVASAVGFSAAFGAFIMGSIMAETVEAEKIEHLVNPVKDLFGAIFFVSVGMMVDVALIGQHIIPILCIIAAIMLGQTLLSTGGFLLAGQSLKTAMQCSFSLTQIGEFAFILATMGTSLGVTSDFLYPIVVAVSVFTTFTTPYMIRLAEPAYGFLKRILPASLLSRLERYASQEPDVVGQTNHWHTYLKQVGVIILIYSVLCMAITAVVLYFGEPLLARMLNHPWCEIITATLAILLISPFLYSLMLKHQGTTFQTLWNDNHFNRAPLVAVQLLRFVMGAAFVSYILGHTVHWSSTLGIFIVIAVVFMIVFSRRLRKESDILEQTFTANLTQRERREQDGRPQFMRGLVERDIHLSTFVVPVGIEWAGKTLAELDLRKTYGIQVVGIQRGQQRINIPSAQTLILPGDRLQVIGTDKQLTDFGHALESMSAEGALKKVPEEMTLRRLVLFSNSPFVGKTIKESDIRNRYQCLVVGVEPEGEGELLTPDPLQRLQVGDIIWVVGEETNINAMEGSKQIDG
ncbi:MAG: cation:proton antiporter [Prevotella sp.]|nr:cation:proton antiporter [Prevotella sp.]